MKIRAEETVILDNIGSNDITYKRTSRRVIIMELDTQEEWEYFLSCFSSPTPSVSFYAVDEDHPFTEKNKEKA